MTATPTEGSGPRALRGKPLADRVRARLKAQAEALAGVGVVPTLRVIVASDDPAVAEYAGAKSTSAAKLGVGYAIETVDPSGGQAALDDAVRAASADPAVHGVLLEMPVAAGLDGERAVTLLDPGKDVDGLTVANMGLIALGREADALAPATPRACLMLAESAVTLKGSRVAVVGRGRTVGRALIPMLLNRDATVTTCHTKTPDLAAALAPCDVVFVAAGRAGLIGAGHLRPGQVVIDAGINVTDAGTVGDVAPDATAALAAFTPVPGGVGPLTSTLIFDNLMRATLAQRPDLAPLARAAAEEAERP